VQGNDSDQYGRARSNEYKIEPRRHNDQKIRQMRLIYGGCEYYARYAKGSADQWRRRFRSQSGSFFVATRPHLRYHRLAPQVDRSRVRGKNRKLPLGELAPGLLMGGRHRCQQRDPGGERRLERAGKTIPGDFELAELVEQHEVAARYDIALNRLGSGRGADAIEMTHSHIGAQIAEDRKPCSCHEVPQIAGLTVPVGKLVVFRDETGQTKAWSPVIGQTPEDRLNLKVRCTTN